MVVVGLAAPAGASETATLSASASVVVFGTEVQLTGAVSADPSCLAGRATELEWRSPDSTAWDAVDSGVTDSAGSFAFSAQPQFTGDFEVSLPQTGACAAVVSSSVQVRVRALVDSTLIASTLSAGSCVDLHVAVSPGKPGQTVDVQRRTGPGWATVDTLTLDADSSASAHPCYGWEDIGVVRLRAVWRSQDSLNVTGTGITLAFRITEAAWMRQIDRLVSGRSISVSVGDGGSFLYERADTTPRTPASNEKLLLSMTMLDELGPDFTIPTSAAAGNVRGGVVSGNLWILGHGDPGITPARMAALAARIADAGITKVRGRVMGAISYFRRDWWAAGWRPGVSRDYVALPTALTFQENVESGTHVLDPELLAAESLTHQLERHGVRIAGKPGSGAPPRNLSTVATIHSPPLARILPRMNRPSDNFYAEVLGKLLGAQRAGPPGTIGKGANQIEGWVRSHDVDFALYDNSGLSYANRVTARGIVRLLWVADDSPWGSVLRRSLPTGGQGTLEDRLPDVKVRAKTGTLTDISALSGWVRLTKDRGRVEFSILSSGMPKWMASSIEDRIVEILASSA